jgi:hypothetical protein
MFQTPVDICNRSAQQVGVARISDFTENSVAAAEFGFNYDKLRRAELRRNLWKFATRKAALRAITTGTVFLAPVMWASTTTYTFGSIVSDQSNTLWQSRTQENLNNSPGNSSAWEQYCGPMTAQPYDITGGTSYYAGELVYEAPGNGTYVVYLSLQSGNSQDPRAPSFWLPTTQYSEDQVVQQYPAWAIGTTYAAGAGVSFTPAGTLAPVYYISLAASNTGNEPDTSTKKWAPMFSTLAPPYYSSIVAYAIGQYVTYLGANYICIAASTGNLPTNATFFAAVGATSVYSSLIDFNLNQDPSLAPVLWAVGTTYATGNKVGGSDENIYSSIGNGNVGNDPTLGGGFWTNTGVLNPWTTVNPFGTANDLWLQTNVAITDSFLPYPLGAGPAFQSTTRNAYRLPANFLREAPQDPKAGSISLLGGPAGPPYNDWNFEGDYIITIDNFPIVLRFVADVTDVTKFDDMFCEGLAARIALETVEILTQSTAKRTAIKDEYLRVMTEARIINGIETGAVEPPVDEYLAVRV